MGWFHATLTHCGLVAPWNLVNSLRPRRNRRHFADDIFKCIFLNENVWILIEFSPKFVPKGPINIISALVQIMAWRRPGDKPLSEPMIVSLPTHICVTRPHYVNIGSRACWLTAPGHCQSISVIWLSSEGRFKENSYDIKHCIVQFYIL